MSFSFAGEVARLEAFLADRGTIVERIERRLLNVKGKEAPRHRDRAYFDAAIDACFEPSGRPREAPAMPAHQPDPADLIVRAYDRWDADRWPGTNARLAHAGTIYGAVVVRRLEDLSLRIWDAPGGQAPAQLREIQRLLDGLNAAHVRAAMIRDANWLVQTAQGPLTRDLAPYFRIAARIAASFPAESGIALHAAGAKLAGGHLRSQVQQRATELGRPADAPEVALVARNSNSMDVALLVWDLVPLLDAYHRACAAADRTSRLALADAIVQGCSSDPELLLTRLDLLAPYTMLETLFVDAAGGRAALTDLGASHVRMVERYTNLIGAAAPLLLDDARAFDPAGAGYSPVRDRIRLLRGPAGRHRAVRHRRARGACRDARRRVHARRTRRIASRRALA
jgi:hypothetical protein